MLLVFLGPNANAAQPKHNPGPVRVGSDWKASLTAAVVVVVAVAVVVVAAAAGVNFPSCHPNGKIYASLIFFLFLDS